MSNRFDLVVYGASGYTGKQAAKFFQEFAPHCTLAIAGRNRRKLEAIATELGLDSDKQILVARSDDEKAVFLMCSQAKVIVNTAGPFAIHGENVIRGCIEHSCDYVDITGETPWVADMIKKYHEAAKSKGLRIIPFCGFDSVPSDMASLWLVNELKQHSQSAAKVKTFVQMKGGFNGGTIASALNMAETGMNRRILDPLLLVPHEMRSDEEKKLSQEPQKATYDEDISGWSAPFFMAPINSAVVRRSRALNKQLSNDYGENFHYHERMLLNRRAKRLPATIASTTQKAFVLATLTPLGRSLIRKLSPAPGEGPNQEAMDSGFMRVQAFAQSESGKLKVSGVIEAAGDPGNRITIKALASCALMLVDTPRSELPGGEAYGGILTPASGLGLGLISKLKEHGFSFNLN